MDTSLSNFSCISAPPEADRSHQTRLSSTDLHIRVKVFQQEVCRTFTCRAAILTSCIHSTTLRILSNPSSIQLNPKARLLSLVAMVGFSHQRPYTQSLRSVRPMVWLNSSLARTLSFRHLLLLTSSGNTRHMVVSC